jgi:hypothetical protein
MPSRAEKHRRPPMRKLEPWRRALALVVALTALAELAAMRDYTTPEAPDVE